MPHRSRALAGLLVAALGLAACGDSGTTTTSAPAVTASTTPAAPTTTTTEARATGESEVAMDGDLVAVHYVGTLDDGTRFDSSEGRAPLTFTVGSGEVIAGFDQAVRGLAVGDSRTVRIEPQDAYGEYDPELVVTVPLETAPEGLEVGRQVRFGGRIAVVVELTEDSITVDANHELAGRALTFSVELVSIN